MDFRDEEAKHEQDPQSQPVLNVNELNSRRSLWQCLKMEAK